VSGQDLTDRFVSRFPDRLRHDMESYWTLIDLPNDRRAGALVLLADTGG